MSVTNLLNTVSNLRHLRQVVAEHGVNPALMAFADPTGTAFGGSASLESHNPNSAVLAAIDGNLASIDRNFGSLVNKSSMKEEFRNRTGSMEFLGGIFKGAEQKRREDAADWDKKWAAIKDQRAEALNKYIEEEKDYLKTIDDLVKNLKAADLSKYSKAEAEKEKDLCSIDDYILGCSYTDKLVAYINFLLSVNFESIYNTEKPFLHGSEMVFSMIMKSPQKKALDGVWVVAPESEDSDYLELNPAFYYDDRKLKIQSKKQTSAAAGFLDPRKVKALITAIEKANRSYRQLSTLAPKALSLFDDVGALFHDAYLAGEHRHYVSHFTWDLTKRIYALYIASIVEGDTYATTPLFNLKRIYL